MKDQKTFVSVAIIIGILIGVLGLIIGIDCYQTSKRIEKAWGKVRISMEEVNQCFEAVADKRRESIKYAEEAEEYLKSGKEAMAHEERDRHINAGKEQIDIEKQYKGAIERHIEEARKYLKTLKGTRKFKLKEEIVREYLDVAEEWLGTVRRHIDALEKYVEKAVEFEELATKAEEALNKVKEISEKMKEEEEVEDVCLNVSDEQLRKCILELGVEKCKEKYVEECAILILRYFPELAKHLSEGMKYLDEAEEKEEELEKYMEEERTYFVELVKYSSRLKNIKLNED